MLQLVGALFRIVGIFAFLLLIMILPSTAEASHNQNLYVSAENPRFNDHFAGSMVIEVIVQDPNISTLGDSIGEPSVTLNGKKLRMAQATDGNWYAYFANKEKAQEADDIAYNDGSGQSGKGLDFGVFCGPSTASSVLGIDFSDTDGVALSTASGISGTTNGKSSLTTCTGTPTSTSTTINNVVRSSTSLNQNSNVAVGQIGIDPDIWPVIQLFSFSNDVTIKYNRSEGTQLATLHYADIENISLNLDRSSYPNNADVIATIYDAQLNQDPTDEDSWTFTAGSTQKTFYQAFTKSGSNAANGGSGLIDLVSKLTNLKFDKNGKLSLDLGAIAELKTNQIQPSSSLSDGTANIVTFVETEPNSGIFVNSDQQAKSNIKITSSAPRGQSAIITYNSQSASIVSSTSTASISLGESKASKSMQISALIPGKKYQVTLSDPDQNLSSMKKDDLHVYNSTAIIPAITIGNPVTLEKTSEAKFYADSGTTLSSSGISSITFRVNDTNSDILLIDTRSAGTTNFEKIAINLGITAQTLQDLLIDDDESNTDGTNWINYDLRSFQNQLGISDFSDTTMTLYFGTLDDASPNVTILDKGDISSAQGLVQIDNTDVTSIKSKTGTVFLVINFDSSSDTSGAGRIASETDRQPIVFDLFSFGESNSDPINNAIYRLELKETTAGSGLFTGSMELSQSSQFGSSFIKTLQTIDDEVKLLINQRLLDEKGIDLKYSDIASAGVSFAVSSQTNANTNTGAVTLNQRTFHFGQPVKIILTDPDLNQRHDTIDIYLTSTDSGSDNVDAVVDQSGNLLLEVKIKDVRYKRCTIDGVETGGLGSAGFTLVETGPSTGIFEGVFKMPTKICNKEGTNLISTAGGSIDVKYHDALDSSGKPNIFGLTFPKSTKESQKVEQKVPDWLKNNVRAWADKKTTDDTFLNGLQYLINQNLISPSKVQSDKLGKGVPSWIRKNADWWSNGLITQDDYLKGIEYLIEKGIIKLP